MKRKGGNDKQMQRRHLVSDSHESAMDRILEMVDEIDSAQFRKIYQSKAEEPEAGKPEEDEDEAEYLALAEKD